MGEPDDVEGGAPTVWELPDTGILFRGYLEAGKMINVFDWYQSFAAALESQRRKGIRAEDQEQGGNSPSEGFGLEDGAEDEDERWGMEVQARFIRGVHELDLMGFLKHTGRKPDHVTRTVFDVSE